MDRPRDRRRDRLSARTGLVWRLRGRTRDFEASWCITVRPALRLLASVFGGLYALDCAYVVATLAGVPMPALAPQLAAAAGYTQCENQRPCGPGPINY